MLQYIVIFFSYYIILFIFIYLVNVPGPLAQYINLTNQRFEALCLFYFGLLKPVA